jgi:hypothetical protein
MRLRWLTIALGVAAGAAIMIGASPMAWSQEPESAPEAQPIAPPLGISQPGSEAKPAHRGRRHTPPKPHARRPVKPAPAAHGEPKPAPEEAPRPAPEHTAEKPKPEPAAPKPEPAAPAKPAAPVKPAPAPQPTGPATGEFQPVIHARNAKITTCMDNIVAQSGSSIDSAHTAISTWSQTAPNDNVFQSIVGLSYGNRSAPNALAVLFAAPLGPTRCQGQTVQIYPTSQNCGAVQAVLIKEGRTVGSLQALPLIEVKGGSRDVLIPSAGGGCVIVAITLR